MKISYKWLSEYLPVEVEPGRLGKILTSIGLEVEDLYKFEEVKGGLEGLVIGEVVTCAKHPNADKLSVTTVDVKSGELLNIVCGAPNVAVGQKVVVAKPGTTIYPSSGEPMQMRVAKIRGVESQGMICAEDEIGLGASHAGILVLNGDARPGMSAAEYFHPYADWVYEIGLTPNRMDAMSHWGVARDVCAYLSHHDRKTVKPKLPASNNFHIDNTDYRVEVTIENTSACQRYSGITITNIGIAPSPLWMQQRLKSIGVRPINNIVDITNYIQHETGQPLHAFDADRLADRKIVVKNLPEGTEFVTLDEKTRKLSAADLMICDGREGVCIAGVFGGLHSGVQASTKNIFLESAWFNPVDIRKTSFRHNLRTDAASRFEKGIDISNTVNVLKRAATMIREICGGQISSDIVDVYPVPREKNQVSLKFHFLKKLSGKNYHPDTVREILTALGFDIRKESIDEVIVAAPLHKPDISLPADVVEEILRIDGLDNIDIPAAITMTPAVDQSRFQETIKEKVSSYLVGVGFNEILTNSITNEVYYDETEMAGAVKMLNNLSADMNVMRPSMLETGLEAVAYNLNRKNNDLLFFDFGKTYARIASAKYSEAEHLCLYVTGAVTRPGWRSPGKPGDLYWVKGLADAVLKLCGIRESAFEVFHQKKLTQALQVQANGVVLVQLGEVAPATLKRFDIRQPVFFADFEWSDLLKLAAMQQLVVSEIPRFPAVNRDLAIVVDSTITYKQAEQAVKQLRLSQLKKINLFDVFESEKLGRGKKSLAINFVFQDNEKTLTDREIDAMMTQIMKTLEQQLAAEIRK